MEGTQQAMNAKARMRGHVEKKMEEGEQARKRKRGEEKEEKGEVVSDKMNVEGDKMIEGARGKRKRGESEDDDVMNRAKSGSIGQVSAEETMKIVTKLEREERKRKSDDGGAQDVDDVEVGGYAVNEKVMNGEAEGWRGGEVDGDELDPELAKMGRKEELEFLVNKQDISEFWMYEEPVSSSRRRRGVVEGWRADDKGGRFVSCN